MTMLAMFPKLSVYDALDGADRQAVVRRDHGLDITVRGSQPDIQNVRDAQLGAIVGLTAPHNRRQSAHGVIIAKSQTLPLRGVPDVLPLSAEPQMGGVAARRVIAGVQDARRVRPQHARIRKLHPVRYFVSDAMGAAHPPSPIRLLMPVLVSGLSCKRPAIIRPVSHDTLPEMVRVIGHSVSLAGRGA